MATLPEQIAAVGKMVFERRLTDIAGGNISAREGNTVFITPTSAGKKWFWNLSPDDILKCLADRDDLMDHPQHSKESISHLLVYRAFPDVNAIIHAHPFNIMPFVAINRPIKPLNLAVEVFGEIGYIPDAPLYSREQGELIVQALAPKQALMASVAAAVLMPRHGIFVAGKNLNTCVDCLERIDGSAFTNLAVKLLM